MKFLNFLSRTNIQIEPTRVELLQKANLLILKLEAKPNLNDVDQQTLIGLKAIAQGLDQRRNWDITELNNIRSQLNAVDARIDPSNQRTVRMTQPKALKPARNKRQPNDPQTDHDKTYVKTFQKWRKGLKVGSTILVIYIFVVFLLWFLIVIPNPDINDYAMSYLRPFLYPIQFIVIGVILIELLLLVWEKILSRRYLKTLKERRKNN